MTNRFRLLNLHCVRESSSQTRKSTLIKALCNADSQMVW